MLYDIASDIVGLLLLPGVTSTVVSVFRQVVSSPAAVVCVAIVVRVLILYVWCTLAMMHSDESAVAQAQLREETFRLQQQHDEQRQQLYRVIFHELRVPLVCMRDVLASLDGCGQMLLHALTAALLPCMTQL
jgi:Na+-translocating ferredoxin:NAD+ oxidoreductase RnfE subunit